MIISQKEKEDLIRKLLSEGRTYRDIAKSANCSPNEIARIKKNYCDNKETNEDMKSKSICSRAFDLFQKGIPITQIVIDLDIEPEQVKKIHDSYLDLLNRQKIVSLLKDGNNTHLKIEILEFLQENPDHLTKIKEAIDIQILIWEKEIELNEANDDLDTTNRLIRYAESRLQKLYGN